MRLLAVTLLALFSLQTMAESPAMREENLYNDYKNAIAKTDFPRLENEEQQKIFIDALEDSLNDTLISPNILLTLEPSSFSLVERLRLEILKIKFHQTLLIDLKTSREIETFLQKELAPERFIYILAANEKLLLEAGEYSIIQLAKNDDHYSTLTQTHDKSSAIEKTIVSDLYFKTPSASSYMNGKFKQSVRVYVLCRTNRLYPCLMIMRDLNGKEVRNPDSSLWTHPVLASSKYGFPSYERNGNTPAGIFTIDSVMASADQQESYGKFRRMMLDFIPKSKNETLLKSLLPASSKEHSWWSSSPVARDIGRSLFRIHGTGKINLDPQSFFYPFVQTSGCIANKENTYDGVTYQNQRVLLDAIMVGLNLKPKFENEPKIKGILYLIEIDDTPAAVAAVDLESFGIK